MIGYRALVSENIEPIALQTFDVLGGEVMTPSIFHTALLSSEYSSDIVMQSVVALDRRCCTDNGNIIEIYDLVVSLLIDIYIRSYGDANRVSFKKMLPEIHWCAHRTLVMLTNNLDIQVYEYINESINKKTVMVDMGIDIRGCAYAVR